MKKNTILRFVAALFVIVGCEKDLQLTPQSDYNAQDFYKSASDFRQALFGAYGGLRTVHGFDYPMLVESLSDNVNTQQNTANLPVARFGFTAGDDRILGVWGAYWAVITRTNNILDQIEDGDFPNEEVRTIMRGETRFIRGFCYFQLGWLFGGMPLIDRVMPPAEIVKIGRSSQEETFAFAAADFAAAAETLPEVQTGDNVGRATRYAALGMLARMHLFATKYEQARPLLEEIIAYEGFAPYIEYGDCFLNTKDNGAEHVFQIQYTTGLINQGNPLVYSLVPENLRSDQFPLGGRSTWVAVSTDLYESYHPMDGRRDITVQKGYTTVNGIIDEETQLFVKFAHGTAPVNKEDNDVNFPILRITDVRLMYAEVLNELGFVADGEALVLLNSVRERAGLTPLGPEAFTDQSSFRDTLFAERRKEFAGEALRWFDIVRQGPERASALMEAFLSRPEEGGGSINFNSRYLLMPIPESEMRNNPALTQNPDY